MNIEKIAACVVWLMVLALLAMGVFTLFLPDVMYYTVGLFATGAVLASILAYFTTKNQKIQVIAIAFFFISTTVLVQLLAGPHFGVPLFDLTPR